MLTIFLFCLVLPVSSNLRNRCNVYLLCSILFPVGGPYFPTLLFSPARGADGGGRRSKRARARVATTFISNGGLSNASDDSSAEKHRTLGPTNPSRRSLCLEYFIFYHRVSRIAFNLSLFSHPHCRGTSRAHILRRAKSFAPKAGF
jgi:hypothetical protein